MTGKIKARAGKMFCQMPFSRHRDALQKKKNGENRKGIQQFHKPAQDGERLVLTLSKLAAMRQSDKIKKPLVIK